jgi:protein-S-isoprenylcysteine O-methyltransferase Ste14
MPDTQTPEKAASNRATVAQWITWITVAGVAVVFVLALSSKTFAPGPLTFSRGVGLALFAVGFVGWTAARLQLGKSFSVQAKATELVTHGIYSKIRNPVYVFGTVIIVGLMLWINRPEYLLVLFIIVPLQIARAHKEAQVLEAKFGDAYRAYRAKTWF